MTKNEFSIQRDGHKFLGYGASLEVVPRFRCDRYLPPGTMPTTPNAVWVGRYAAQKQNPGVPAYRCRGVIVVDKTTGLTSFTTACECSASRIESVPLSSTSTVSAWMGPLKVNDTGRSVANVAGERRGVKEEPANNACFGTAVGNMSRNVGGGVELRVRKAINYDEDDTSLSSDDASSVTSDKAYYKDLCGRLTASLVDKKATKRENKRVKRENQRLKQENMMLNGKLRNISNLCADRNGNN
jgi:hypothetical protein